MKAILTADLIATHAPPSGGARISWLWDQEVRGLGLRILRSGLRSFVLEHSSGGTTKRITLGQWPGMGLVQARKAARAMRAAGSAQHRALVIHSPRAIDEPAIYFLLQDGEIVYVGKSSGVFARIGAHAANGDKRFDSVVVIPVPEDRLEFLERTYIAKLRPKYNKRDW